MSAPSEDVIAFHRTNLERFDEELSCALLKRPWLQEPFLERIAPHGTILDLGCGSGEPIARCLIESGDPEINNLGGKGAAMLFTADPSHGEPVNFLGDRPMFHICYTPDYTPEV